MRFYSHTGHYFCPECGYSRPKPQVRAVKVINDGFDRLRVEVETPEQRGEIVIPLPGLYNVYNALAAIAIAQALQVAWSPIVSGIEQFKPAFGRGERVQINGRTVRLLLAKNPTGFNEVLRTLFNEDSFHKQNVLLILNDNIADGRDISWIWDVDIERMVGRTNTLTISGTRALDMALRMKYAGVSEEDMLTILPAPLRAALRSLDIKERRKLRRSRSAKSSGAQTLAHHETGVAALAPARGATTTFQGEVARQKEYGITKALDAAINRTPAGETLFVVPTYTGLLEIHRELERRGLTPHYWEEKGP
jgi:hypothetical protein